MYNFYAFEGSALQVIAPEVAVRDLSRVVWIDLLEPTEEEETFVEKLLSIDIPTSDEMHEIELSNRLYQENGALYTTFTLITKADQPIPDMASITLVLAGHTLISVRYSDPQPFKVIQTRLQKVGVCQGSMILTELLESVINRLADVLENIGHKMDALTHSVFLAGKDKPQRPDYEETMRQVARSGDALSKTRESLVSINRMVGFLIHLSPYNHGKDHDRMRTVLHDITALSDHASFLSGKVSFMLDATLGLINIEQNAIIKIVSVGTIVFMPPTLLASIYGMNFQVIPELHWVYGYPMALTMMVLAAFLPYKYFKLKGWL